MKTCISELNSYKNKSFENTQKIKSAISLTSIFKNPKGFENNLISNKNAYYFETDIENKKLTRITSMNINSAT